MKEGKDILSTHPPRPSSILSNLILKPISNSNCSLKTLIDYHTNYELNEDTLNSTLPFIRKETPLAELTDNEVGSMGERACYRFLSELFKNKTFISEVSKNSGQRPRSEYEYDIIHLNGFTESFKPYDIEIDSELFIDVKTTRQQENTLFHVSITEALFISENYNRYLFARVFPLIPCEKYLGIKIASNWGVVFCRLKEDYKYKDEFIASVNEVKTISQGDGFLIKTEWLENILLKGVDDFIDLFNSCNDIKNRYVDLPGHHYGYNISKIKNFDNVTKNFELNYKIAHLIKILGEIYFKRDIVEYKTLINKPSFKEILAEWNEHSLEKFILDCENFNLNTIKYFAANLLCIQTESDIGSLIVDCCWPMDRAYSFKDKHPEFDEFSSIIVIFNCMVKYGYNFYTPNKLSFRDDDINEIIRYMYRYKDANQRRKDAIKTMMQNIKYYASFETALRLLSWVNT